MEPQEIDDWEEVGPEISPQVITEGAGVAPPPAPASQQYTPEEQERLQMYLENEKNARKRASSDRHNAVQSRASAMLGTLGGVAPKSSLDYEGSRAAENEANKAGQMSEYLMKNATERQKQALALQSAKQEKENDRDQQDKRDLAKQEFESKMFAAKTDNERQKAADEYKKQLSLLGAKLKGEKEVASMKSEMKPEKDPTQPQFQSAGYARRLEQAESDFDSLNQEGFKPTSGSRFIAGMLPEGMQSDQAQRFNQAKRNFVNSVLRKESGAAISQGEFDNAEKQYFPQPGDSAHVVAQKKANRAQKLAEFKAEAGNAYDKVPLIATESPKKKAGGSPDIGTATAGPSPQQALVKEGDKYFRTTASGEKKQVLKAFKDNSDGKIHYKYSDGTVE